MHHELPVPVNPATRNALSHDRPFGTKNELARALLDLAPNNSRAGAILELVARLNSTYTSIWPDPEGVAP